MTKTTLPPLPVALDELLLNLPIDVKACIAIDKLVKKFGEACAAQARSDLLAELVTQVDKPADMQGKLVDKAAKMQSQPQWLPINSAPKDETTSFLVLLPRNAQREECVIQVSRFQGDLYPDYLGGIVDFDDRITDALAWMPLPASPSAEVKP